MLHKKVRDLEKKVNLLSKVLDLQIKYNRYNTALHSKDKEINPNSINTKELDTTSMLLAWLSQEEGTKE